MTPPPWIMPAIVLSQFAGTSLWFASNAVLEDLQAHWNLSPDALGDMTSAVQLGFIAGTLIFAFFAIADQFSPRKVFFVCSLAGAGANLGLYLWAEGLGALLAFRFLTGFFLAGIYPVGMKIAAGWYQADLGRAIGLLVGALVLGTAFPHLVRSLGTSLPWTTVILTTAAVAALGGLLMLLAVPDGPHLAKGARFDPKALLAVARIPNFRASAFGYFGHMWELYAFWAFVPFLLAAYAAHQGLPELDVAWWSFWIIAVGSLGCVVGGVVSVRWGSARVAFGQLAVSGVCCLLSPVLFYAPPPLFLAFLLVWGITVVGDSPQFSALNARNAPPRRVGSALTIVNCLGFSISIISIQMVNELATRWGPELILIPLFVGPVFGLWALRPLLGRAIKA